MQCLMPVILPPWPSRPTSHWKTVFCYNTCIHTFVHTHQTAWSCSLLWLNCVPGPKGIRCIWLECIHVCHTEDAGRLHEAHNARVEIAYLRACRAGLSWRKCTGTVWAMSCHCNIKDLCVFKTHYLMEGRWKEDQSRFWKCRFVSL